MNIAVRKVAHEDKSVLHNLMQLYLYDMSQYTNADISRHGIGEHAAVYLFDLLPGTWEVRELSSNVVAHSFWRKVIRQYTNDDYQECILSDERWNGPIQTFQSRYGKI